MVTWQECTTEDNTDKDDNIMTIIIEMMTIITMMTMKMTMVTWKECTTNDNDDRDDNDKDNNINEDDNDSNGDLARVHHCLATAA